MARRVAERRLAVDRRAARALERGNDLRLHRGRRGVADDAAQRDAVGPCRAVHGAPARWDRARFVGAGRHGLSRWSAPGVVRMRQERLSALRQTARSSGSIRRRRHEGAHSPFFSPDGRWIAFFADGRLKKVALAGGTPVTLADAPTLLGGVWIDREIMFAGSPSGGLMRVSSDGGEPRALTVPTSQRRGASRLAIGRARHPERACSRSIRPPSMASRVMGVCRSTSRLSRAGEHSSPAPVSRGRLDPMR